MRSCRQYTIRVRTTARDVPKSVELEQRVSRLELALKEIREALDVISKRLVALQAHLDHVAARVDRR